MLGKQSSICEWFLSKSFIKIIVVFLSSCWYLLRFSIGLLICLNLLIRLYWEELSPQFQWCGLQWGLGSHDAPNLLQEILIIEPSLEFHFYIYLIDKALYSKQYNNTSYKPKNYCHKNKHEYTQIEYPHNLNVYIIGIYRVSGLRFTT